MWGNKSVNNKLCFELKETQNVVGMKHSYVPRGRAADPGKCSQTLDKKYFLILGPIPGGRYWAATDRGDSNP